MKKIYRYIKFYIKTAFRNLLRHLGLTFSASLAVSITLLLISLFMLISANITNVTYHIEGELTIRASIDNIVKDEELAQLQSAITALPDVKKVTYSSGKEELTSYQKEYGENNRLFAMYEGENSPIRDAFLIEVTSGSKVKRTASAIRELKGIVSAEYGGSATEELIKGLEMIRSGSMIFIAFLLFIAIFLISNKIKMSIYTRKNEIAIMRFVGTSNISVKLPMMLEGMAIGFLGALLPVILTIVLYRFLYEAMHGALLSNIMQMQPVFPLTIYISVILVGLGMLVGFFGGFLSTTRYLRWKR